MPRFLRLPSTDPIPNLHQIDCRYRCQMRKTDVGLLLVSGFLVTIFHVQVKGYAERVGFRDMA